MAASESKKPKRGRPTIFTQKIADELCAHLAMGESLRTACARKNMPAVKTVFNWFHRYPDFVQQYEKAKQEAADAMAEEILDIADTPLIGEEITIKGYGKKQTVEVSRKEMLGHRRLQIDTRKFLMAKMKPKRYGEKLDLTTDGEKLPTPIYGGKSSGNTE